MLSLALSFIGGVIVGVLGAYAGLVYALKNARIF